ncbi:fatty acyl-AMP ligase [Streptomyces sp. NPDC055239]
MEGHRNFIELLRTRVEQSPQREAMVLLPDDGARGRPNTVSYRSLDASARVLAGWLQDRGVQGERALLMHESRHQFAVSFLACLYAGVIAVPVPSSHRRGHNEARVSGIVKDAAPAVVLTDAAQAPDVSRLLVRSASGSIMCLAADAVPGSAPWRMPDQAPDAVAYLQYTSGATGAPRGVAVTHENLMANQRALVEALGTSPGESIGGWLPFHHDMGLVGQLLHPLWLGGTSVLLSPEAFVRHPVRWLQAIGDYQIAVSGAPDFAYDLCVRRVSDEQLAGLDLSGWRTAVSGGEPLRAGTRRAFTRRFAPAGFRPQAMTAGYGLAESTLLVAATCAGEQGGELEVDAAGLEKNLIRGPREGQPVRTLLSSGRPVGGEIHIVQPETRAVLPDGEIGEIWVRGGSVAAGYWQNRSETARTFNAVTADGRSPFLRTGDLGTLEEGRLYVTGRIKDMIVVAGRNLYPHDLEYAVQQISALFGAGTAFGVTGERERIVIVQEVRTQRWYDLDFGALAADVGRCITEEFEVPVGGVLLVRPGTVRRTTSGKVERGAMRELFLNGRLRPLCEHLDDELAALSELARLTPQRRNRT